MHSLSGAGHLVVRCFPPPTPVTQGETVLPPEPSLISWFKNHTCETRSRWEILLVDSAEAMVHYQVISLGHSEVIT